MEHLQILWVLRSFTPAGAGVKGHTHPYFHAFYLIDGECDFTVNEEDYKLTAGDCIIVPRGAKHRFQNNSGESIKHIEIKFSLKGAASNAEVFKKTLFLKNNLLVGLLLKRITREYSELERFADESAAAYLWALLNVMTEDARHKKDRAFRFLDATGYSPLSQEIVHYLEDHYSESISLDELAAALDYNKSYLCIAFKKDTETTILDCLNMIRIRRAAELIAYSDHELAQVVTLCGFSSVSHFNLVFVKYVGTTPGQVRRACPKDILFSYDNPAGSLDTKSERFMYSVLARKRISLDKLSK